MRRFKSCAPVEGKVRLVELIYSYASLAEVREIETGARWLVGLQKRHGNGYLPRGYLELRGGHEHST